MPLARWLEVDALLPVYDAQQIAMDLSAISPA
jgi:hypothetical protein